MKFRNWYMNFKKAINLCKFTFTYQNRTIVYNTSLSLIHQGSCASCMEFWSSQPIKLLKGVYDCCLIDETFLSQKIVQRFINFLVGR